MSQVTEIILPVFGLLGLGYFAAWSGYLGEEVGRGLELYSQRVAIPLLVFRMLVNSEPPETAPLALIASYFGAVAIVWVLASLLSPAIAGVRDVRVATIATGSTYSNSALLGLPLVLQTFGEPGAFIFLILFPIHLPILAVANALHVELLRGEGVEARRLAASVFWSMATNTILLSILAGILWRMTGLGIPPVAEGVSKAVADTGITVALFTMGLTLRKYGVADSFRAAVLMSVLKLVALPATVWCVAGLVFGLDPVTVGVLTVFAAAPVGVTTYIFATRTETGLAEASSGIALSTLLSIVTITIVLTLLSPA